MRVWLLGLHRMEGITSLAFCLPFSPLVLSHPRNFFIQIFPILLLFLGSASFRLYNSSSDFAVLFSPGKSKFPGWDLSTSHYPDLQIPIVPSSSSSSSGMRSWNIASDPGSWNSKSTDPSPDPAGSGADPQEDFTWSQFHLDNPGNFCLNQADDPAGMPEPGMPEHLDLLCWIWAELEDPRILG